MSASPAALRGNPVPPARLAASAAPSVANRTGFDLFWSSYPIKYGRDQAKATWDEINPSPAHQDAILGALNLETGDRERARRAGQSVTIPPASMWLADFEANRRGVLL